MSRRRSPLSNGMFIKYFWENIYFIHISTSNIQAITSCTIFVRVDFWGSYFIADYSWRWDEYMVSLDSVYNKINIMCLVWFHLFALHPLKTDLLYNHVLVQALVLYHWSIKRLQDEVTETNHCIFGNFNVVASGFSVILLVAISVLINAFW